MDLTTLLDQPRALPSIPAAVSALMAELDQPEPSLQKMGQLLASDLALTTRVLRLANSSFFSLQRQVNSVEEAALVLGLSHVRTMVMAAALGSAFRVVEGVDLVQFWRYSLNVSKIAKALASTLKQDVNAASTAGLIHGLGDLVMHMGMPEDMRRLDFSVPPLALDRPYAEHVSLGYTYSDVSAAFAGRWNFPSAIVEALTHLQAPFDGDVHAPIAGILHMAVWRSRALELGLDEAGLAATYPQSVALNLGLDLTTVLQKDPDQWAQQSEWGAFVE